MLARHEVQCAVIGYAAFLAGIHVVTRDVDITPTLLLAGELESEALVDAAAALQDGRAVVIPNLGHIRAFLRSDLVLPHVVPFLRSVTSA